MVITESRHRTLRLRVTDPEGRRWSIWRLPLPWRPRSPELVAGTVLEARNLPDDGYLTLTDLVYEVARGVLVVVIASALAVVELAALVVAWVPWWVVVRATGRPVRLELYRDGAWSRTRRADRADVDRVVAELARAVETGTLDPPRRRSGPRPRRSRT